MIFALHYMENMLYDDAFANPVQNGSTCIMAGDAASLRDIGISQCANPVQNGSKCIEAV